MSATRQSRTVERARLLDRLQAERATPLVTVLAPAGYGKSTLTAQWAATFDRSAYLRLTANHADPTELMIELASALQTIVPIDEEAIRSLASRGLAPGLVAAGRLAEALSRHEGTAVLLLDDVHVLADRHAGDALSLFLEQVPASIQVVVAGHDAPVLRLPRLQAAGKVLAFDESDLAFDESETAKLARALGVSLTSNDLSAITAETSGWPVAIALTLQSLAAASERGEPPPDAPVMRSTSEFIRRELVEPLAPDARAWLLRSSVLDVMTGPLCDTALEVTGSLARLRELETSSLLIQPTDQSRHAYTYHPLLRDVLRAELHAVWPGEREAIAARAAGWYHGQGQMLEALEFANQSGDRDLLATLVTSYVWPLHWSGRIATLERWVREFDREGVREHYAQVAAVAGFVCIIDGRRHKAEFWLAAGEAAQGPDLMPEGSTRGAWLAVLRGMLLGHGVDALIADAETAEAGMRPDSPFMPGVRLMRVIAAWLSGRPAEALALAADVAAVAAARGALPGYAMATGIESSLALRAGQGRRARSVVEAACGKIGAAGMSEYVLAAPLHAVAARVALMNGDPDEARVHLANVLRSRPQLTDSAPWLSVPARLDAIEALIALRDIASARTLMREVEDILRVRPHLGTITDDVRAARERLVAITQAGGEQWTLTAAELRVLQYLPTHLTFGEIAERLYVSPHTVKSQAVAIYGKLGVSSRRAAIEKAVEVGLLDGSALRYPLGPEADTGIG